MTSLDFQNIVIMNLEKLVAVAGISGVFRLVANRNNGLIIEDLDTGKRSFASSRKHQFTPLETIGIFIDNGETEELKVIFQKIKDTKAEIPYSKDNYFFAIQTVDELGHASLPVFPVPIR